MERLIRMRKEVPEIGRGDYRVIDTGKPGVLVMRYDWRNNSVLIVHNLYPEPVEIFVDPGCGEHSNLLIDIVDSESSKADDKGQHRLLLEAHAYRWFRVGGLDYLLRRTEI